MARTGGKTTVPGGERAERFSDEAETQACLRQGTVGNGRMSASSILAYDLSMRTPRPKVPRNVQSVLSICSQRWTRLSVGLGTIRHAKVQCNRQAQWNCNCDVEGTDC